MSGRDPLVSLALAVAAALVATLSASLAVSVSVLAIGLAGLVREGVPVARIGLALAPFAFFSLTTTWAYWLAPAAEAGPAGATIALVTARTMAVGAVSSLFVLTVDAPGLARALVHRVGVPRRVAAGLLGALQILPALREDLAMIRLAARSRRPAGGGWANRLRGALAGLSPGMVVALLAAAMRRATATALALELRGVASDGKPTRWRVPAFTAADRWRLGGGLAVLAGVVTVSRVAGLP